MFEGGGMFRMLFVEVFCVLYEAIEKVLYVPYDVNTRGMKRDRINVGLSLKSRGRVCVGAAGDSGSGKARLLYHKATDPLQPEQHLRFLDCRPQFYRPDILLFF